MNYFLYYALNYAAKSLIREGYHFIRNDIREAANRPIEPRKTLPVEY